MEKDKEFILCAAYLFKEGYITPCMEQRNEELKKDKKDSLNGDIKNIYNLPHRQVFNMAIGWRHCDILYKYGGCIQKESGGGFMTSKGRYVDRKEAAKIAFEAGQIDKEIETLYSEDLY